MFLLLLSFTCVCCECHRWCVCFVQSVLNDSGLFPFWGRFWHSYTLPKKIQTIYESRDTSLGFCWYQQFCYIWKSANFAISRNTCIDCILIQNFNSLNFSWVFRNCFNKKVTILMMPAKMATPGLLKITVFWNKDYGVIVYVHDVTKKFLSRDSVYIYCGCGHVTKVW